MVDRFPRLMHFLLLLGQLWPCHKVWERHGPITKWGNLNLYGIYPFNSQYLFVGVSWLPYSLSCLVTANITTENVLNAEFLSVVQIPFSSTPFPPVSPDLHSLPSRVVYCLLPVDKAEMFPSNAVGESARLSALLLREGQSRVVENCY